MEMLQVQLQVQFKLILINSPETMV